MDEAGRCDRVALVHGGAVLAVDAPAAIAASYDRPLLAVRAADRYAALRAIRLHAHTHAVYPFGETLHFADARAAAPAEVAARDLAAFLDARGIVGASVEPILVAGDALGTSGGTLAGSNPSFTEDADAAKATVVKLGKLTFETLLVGHGEPILEGASAQVAALAAAS
jgi:hypothetical protein